MFDKIIAYSIENKFVIGLMVLALIIWGLFSLRQLPLDAVPDITNNQVQVITTSPTLATQEVEQFITTPIELALQNVQQLKEIRSISRFGLSVITVVFEEDMDIYLARQLVSEYLQKAQEEIPAGLGVPEMAPISTGLGEIYQYTLRPAKGFEEQYPPTELRTIQDWIISRQLSGIEGVIEVNTLGGYLKQYEVALNPTLLKSLNITLSQVYEALANSNENTGGAYIEKNPNTYYIRTDGIAKSIEDIEHIVVEVRNQQPILIKNVAEVKLGKAPRYGAVTQNGEEVVSGTVMMLKGENSAAVTARIKERIEQVKKSLPEGVILEPFLVRDKLVSTAISTVKTNLIEGGLIVVFILVLMLGNWRAGLIVASVIPLAMLFAISMMNVLGISANLMSLGAIDFGLVVDGAVIIVEAIIHRLHINHAGERLNQQQMDREVLTASQKIRSSAAFGEIIILIVYLPILALVGIEGKMFIPMAETVMLAIGGALVLSLTYVPMMSALFLSKKIKNETTIADRIIAFFQSLYQPALRLAFRFKSMVILLTIALFVWSLFTFSKMGGEFIPTLEEGDLALHQILPPGSSLTQSIETSKIIQEKLLSEFPEVEEVVTKIGSAEIPTDPMPVETGDIIVIMKPKEEWTSAHSRKEMFEKMEKSLHDIPGLAYEFSQPIQMRFNELMTGSRADIAIKLFGNDLDLLYEKAKKAENIINNIDGVGSTKVEQTLGMPQIVIDFKYDRMAQYGLQVKDVNRVVRAAFAGEVAGTIYEEDRRFELVVRMDEQFRKGIADVENLLIHLSNGSQIPLSSIATVQLKEAPMQISRENTNRRIVIGVNVGNTDVESLVEKIQNQLDKNISLPSGYYFSYGGQFENLKEANARLSIAVPFALSLIFILLYFTFRSIAQALLIFTAIPLSVIGGIWALEFRDMPFSISAGIGFIALFGVAVLNGIVLIGYFNQLKAEGMTDIKQRIFKGTQVRLRPVLMTAMVASFGFLPMALSNSGGAEVQQPLATVVIGGLISATFLTLIVLPILYSWLAKWQEDTGNKSSIQRNTFLLLLLALSSTSGIAQTTSLSMEEAVAMALQNHPQIQYADLQNHYAQTKTQIPYDLGNTAFSYQGDGLFRENGQRVNQFGITQQIPHPAKVKGQNEWQNQLLKGAILKKKWTEQQVVFEVKKNYLYLQYVKELDKLYQNIHTTIEKYVDIANLRVEVGAANRIESLTLQTQWQEYKLLVEQNKLEIDKYENWLTLFLQHSQKVSSSDSLEIWNLMEQKESDNIRLQMANQEIQIQEANSLLLTTATKPDFTLGYAAQHFYEGGWLHGLQAGIEIPFFNKQNKQKLRAQQVQIQIAQSQYKIAQLEYQERLLQIKNNIASYRKGLLFYKKLLDDILPELKRISTLNYQAGELSYLALSNTLGLVFQYQEKYLQQLHAHNKAILEYQFINAI